jgi:hypothetical protein
MLALSSSQMYVIKTCNRITYVENQLVAILLRTSTLLQLTCGSGFEVPAFFEMEQMGDLKRGVSYEAECLGSALFIWFCSLTTRHYFNGWLFADSGLNQGP